MSTIVQKFGGTSLGNAERLLNVASIVKNTLASNRLIVVVSAMSSYTKSEGTTSRLILAGEQAITGGPFYRTLDSIEATHFEALEDAIQDPDIQAEIKEHIHHELKTLKSFLEAIHVIREISPRSQDMIVGTGERLSARLLSGVLRGIGIDAVYTDLSQAVTDASLVNNQNFYAQLQKDLYSKFSHEEQTVPIVTGYFGYVQGGIIDRIGRGYTDLTAAIIAAESHAEELQIWKEVDGIFSADPRKVPNAKVVDEITPSEAAELTYFGSEVIHPFTMERAIKEKVIIRIKNTFSPEKFGTIIVPDGLRKDDFMQRRKGKTAVAVTAKNHIHVVNITSNRMLHSSGFMSKVFEAFRDHQITIDLISTTEVSVSCTVEKPDNLNELVTALSELGEVVLKTDRAILSIVGEGMCTTSGTAGRMFMALAQDSVNIEMITQGASEINISCVVSQSDAVNGLQAIHREFMEKA